MGTVPMWQSQIPWKREAKVAVRPDILLETDLGSLPVEQVLLTAEPSP